MSGRAGPTDCWPGFLHPLSGFDHVLAMVAVGLWGAQLRCTCHVGAPGGISTGHGDGRHARLSRRTDPRRGIRNSRFSDRARNRSGVRSAAFSCYRGSPGRMLRDLPRLCARYRTPTRPKRIALQHGLRHGDWLPACGGHRHRPVHKWSWGQQLLRGAGTVVAAGGFFFMWKAFA